MDYRRLGKTEYEVSSIAFGAFKIGRNQGIKYPHGYGLPDRNQVKELLHLALELGINYIDTAPAYGLSEERLGAILGGRQDLIISTKTGEQFSNGRSHYDFSRQATLKSIETSLKRLRRQTLDLIFIHSDGADEHILKETAVLETLFDCREKGWIRAIGFSAKTVAGAELALQWVDVLMLSYNIEDRSYESIIEKAAKNRLGVVVKKGLASGHLAAETAIPFVLSNPNVHSLLVATLNHAHLRANITLAESTDR